MLLICQLICLVLASLLCNYHQFVRYFQPATIVVGKPVVVTTINLTKFMASGHHGPSLFLLRPHVHDERYSDDVAS